MTQGRHRQPNDNTTTMKKIALGATVGLGAVAVPATFAGTASAATTSQWDQLASCESSGNWQAPGGGGVQIIPSTWAAYGGTAYAPTAEQATKAQQIAIAEKVLADQGPNAWSTISGTSLGDTSNGSCVGLLTKADANTDNPGTAPGSTATTTPPATTPPATGGTLDPITGATVPKPKEGSPADLAVKYAIAAIGYNLPYVYGGNGPEDGGWDCSGLTSQAWKAGGVDFTESGP